MTKYSELANRELLELLMQEELDGEMIEELNLRGHEIFDLSAFAHNTQAFWFGNYPTYEEYFQNQA